MEKVKDEIEGAVRSGPMTRKQAVAEYERIKRTLKRKGEVTRELHREIEEEMRDLRSGEGNVSPSRVERASLRRQMLGG